MKTVGGVGFPGSTPCLSSCHGTRRRRTPFARSGWKDGNGLTNTRTTLTWFPIRLLMWNMPYHAEHHLYPSIPFHQLPALHVKIRGHLKHLASSYVAANRAVAHPHTRRGPIRDFAKQVVVCPCQVLDLDNKLGPNPVDAAEDER
jgi:Fatty acid desaturase